MTYEDPRSGRERNLGQDNIGNSTGSLIVGIVFLAAIVFGGWYFYNHSQKAADTATTQPATSSTSSSTGASSGNTGVGGDNTNVDKSTLPSQDTTGVKSGEGSKNAPAANAPAPSNNNSTTTPPTNP